jgi:DNA-binding transcriptional MerR regulator
MAGFMSQQLYKPAEACKIAEVAPYVLRYWETEFPALSEGKEKTGPRAYTERDVRVIARIRELLYDEGFTVAGAKKRLEAELAEGRFDEGLETAPPPVEQRVARKSDSAPAGATTPASPAPTSSASVSPAPARPSKQAAATAAASSKTTADAPPFRPSAATAVRDAGNDTSAERKRVIRELKDIVRLLDRTHRK